MVQLFRAPSAAFIALATILGILISISLPTVHTFDVVRVRYQSNGVKDAPDSTQSLRWGIWGWCEESVGSSNFNCHHTGLAYSITLESQAGGARTVGRAYTRGLIFHPISLAFCLITLLLGFFESLNLLALLVSCFGALVTAIALAIDIVLYTRVHKESNDLKGVKSNTDFGPAFWMTLVQLVLILLAVCTICTGHRRERIGRYGPGTSYPML